jgi:hypothetical protein
MGMKIIAGEETTWDLFGTASLKKKNPKWRLVGILRAFYVRLSP